MLHDANTAFSYSDQSDVLVVGGGPVGMRVAQDLLGEGRAVTVLSAEPELPYNRVRLSAILSGDAQFGELALASSDVLDLRVQLSQRAVAIDRVKKRVLTASGEGWPYETLILALGSSAFVPNIQGRDLPGVYTFRTARDASALVARSISARKVAIIGGGLLGLEAARGFRRRQCAVTVVEHEPHLMSRQIDGAGAAQLMTKIEDLGIQVAAGVAVRHILGTDRVTGLSLDDGTDIPCDTVLFCTGVRPNIDLARQSGLAVGRGITVNDRMQTSDPSIYAIGECAEHRGRLYGVVGPGLAQAEAAVTDITRGGATFAGAEPATKLKVIGADVFSVGDIRQLEAARDVVSHVYAANTLYRRIFLRRGALVGAIAVGPWDQTSRVQDAVQRGTTVYPWMLYRFRHGGDLWTEVDLAPQDMPDSAILCNCTGVTCGQVRTALSSGCSGVEAVSARTGAGSVCGTCRPLLGEMIEAGGAPAPMPLWRPLLALSGLALLVALIPILWGYVPLPTQYDAESLRNWLWRDNIVKQWSGFVLLGITLAALVIGLRKRIRSMDRLGSYDAWRMVHIGIGLAALAALFVHTGFNLGAGWNLALGLSFVGVATFGALAGLATGGDHTLRGHRIGSSRKPPRRMPTWAHILMVWPLPALIGFHVLASYAF